MIRRLSGRHLTVVEKRPRPRTATGRLPDLKCLHTFIVLAEELDVYLAAMRVGIAPSHVNRLVKRLENDMRAVLFRRSHAGIELTSAGERLLPPARALIDAAARLATDLSSRSGPACDEPSDRRLPVRLSERPL